MTTSDPFVRVYFESHDPELRVAGGLFYLHTASNQSHLAAVSTGMEPTNLTYEASPDFVATYSEVYPIGYTLVWDNKDSFSAWLDSLIYCSFLLSSDQGVNRPWFVKEVPAPNAYQLTGTNGGKYYLKARDNDKKLITHLPDSSKGEGDDFLIVTGNWEHRGAEGKTIGFHCPHPFGKPPKLSSNINKEEQSRAIKLALTFDGFESTPLGFGRASHVLLDYTPSYWSGIRKEGKGRPRPPVEQEPAVEPQPELPSHPAGNKNKKGRGGSNNKKGGRRNRISSDRNTTVAILSEHLVGVEEDSYLSPATSPNMSRLGSPSDGTHPLTPPAGLSSPTHPLTPPAGLSSPTAICLTTPPALSLSASANTSNIMDSSGISGKRARDTTHMEVPSSRQNVGQSESSSSQLTKRVSQEAAYDLVQRAMEKSREAVEQAKETKKKLIEQNVRQSKIIEDLRKENDNLKNEKAAVERRAVETQKKIEEATCKIEILKAKLQKTQNAFKHEFKHGYDRGYEDGTGNRMRQVAEMRCDMLEW